MTEVTGSALGAYLEGVEDLLPEGALETPFVKSPDMPASLESELHDGAAAVADADKGPVPDTPSGHTCQHPINTAQAAILACFHFEDVLASNNGHVGDAGATRSGLPLGCIFCAAVPLPAAAAYAGTTTAMSHVMVAGTGLFLLLLLLLLFLTATGKYDFFYALGIKLLRRYPPASPTEHLTYLLRAVVRLNVQASKALLLIKHAELHARGYSLSGNLPPIARIEMQSANPDGTSPAYSLQCIPLRRALSRALDELNGVLELETLSLSAPHSDNIIINASTASSSTEQTIFIHRLQRQLSQARRLTKQCKNYAVACAATARNLEMYAHRSNTRLAAASARLSSAAHALTLEMGDQSAANQRLAQVQHEEQRNSTTLHKMNEDRAKIAHIAGPLDLSIGKARAALAAVSMDMFVIRQEARAIVAEVVASRNVSSCSSSSCCSSSSSSSPPLSAPASSSSIESLKIKSLDASLVENRHPCPNLHLGEWSRVATRVRNAREAWHAQHDRVTEIWEEIEVSLAYAARQTGAGPDWSINRADRRGNCSAASQQMDHDEAIDAGGKHTHGKLFMADQDRLSSPSKQSLVDEDGKKLVSVFEGVASKPLRRARHEWRSLDVSSGAPSLLSPAISLKVELDDVLAHRSPLLERVRNIDRTGWSDPRQGGESPDTTNNSSAKNRVNSSNADRSSTGAKGTTSSATDHEGHGPGQKGLGAVKGPKADQGMKREGSDVNAIVPIAQIEPVLRRESPVLAGDFLAALQNKLSSPAHDEDSLCVFET
jgi:hypothetical protein